MSSLHKLIALALTAFAATAAAQTYPSKPVRVLVPFAPGGATDIFARMAAAEMTKGMGQQVIVENRPGAGTTIAAEFVARSPADGYVLLYTDLSTHTITRSLYAKLGYDPMKDFTPVALVANAPMHVPTGFGVQLIVVDEGPDAADDWIATHAAAGDIVVTADILLADRCLKSGAAVIAPNGKPFTPGSIGGARTCRRTWPAPRGPSITRPSS